MLLPPLLPLLPPLLPLLLLLPLLPAHLLLLLPVHLQKRAHWTRLHHRSWHSVPASGSVTQSTLRHTVDNIRSSPSQLGVSIFESLLLLMLLLPAHLLLLLPAHRRTCCTRVGDRLTSQCSTTAQLE